MTFENRPAPKTSKETVTKPTPATKATKKKPPPKKSGKQQSSQPDTKIFPGSLNGNARINRKKKVATTEQEILLEKYKGPFVRIEGDLVKVLEKLFFFGAYPDRLLVPGF
jgi:hypothetical protein